jgi:hypothetical protein
MSFDVIRCGVMQVTHGNYAVNVTYGVQLGAIHLSTLVAAGSLDVSVDGVSKLLSRLVSAETVIEALRCKEWTPTALAVSGVCGLQSPLPRSLSLSISPNLSLSFSISTPVSLSPSLVVYLCWSLLFAAHRTRGYLTYVSGWGEGCPAVHLCVATPSLSSSRCRRRISSQSTAPCSRCRCWTCRKRTWTPFGRCPSTARPSSLQM